MKVLIVIPAYNEEKIIKDTLLRLVDFIKANLAGYDCSIVVADNSSDDQTARIVEEMSASSSIIKYWRIDKKGKGLAIKTVWEKSFADFDAFVFMDADLAVDLKALPKLIGGIFSGYDLVIGSRYLKESEVDRPLLRKIFSFFYHILFSLLLRTKIKDMACGFKAVNKKVIERILPQVEDTAWFFDHGIVYAAEMQGYKILEIPVKWHEPRNNENKSRVNLGAAGWGCLQEMIKLKRKMKEVK